MRKIIELKHAVKDPHRVNCHMFISLVSNSQFALIGTMILMTHTFGR